MPGRQRRTEDELRAASDHLAYEISMLRSSGHALLSGISLGDAVRNALLESFTIHARVLLDFLYAEDPHRDDVIAEDFFQSPDVWLKARPQKPPSLDFISRRVGKEVAHLTYARQGVTPEAKSWPVQAILADFETVLRAFIELVPKNLLGVRWQFGGSEPAQREERDGRDSEAL